MKSLVFALLALAFASPAWAQDTFHGNVARTGVYETPGPTRFGGVKWTFATGGPVVASPVVSGGVVYIGSLDGRLYAIDQETGTEKWRYQSKAPIASSAAVSGDEIYVVLSTGALAALDVETGELAWSVATEYERKFEARHLHGYAPASQTFPDAWDLFTSSPAVVDGKVYFGCGDGGVYAVDADAEALLWKFSTGGVVHASPAVVDGVVYVGSWDSRFYAIDAETGEMKWSFAAGVDPAIHNQEGFQSSAAVADGVVYVGCRDAHVYAFDARTGEKKWDYPTTRSWVVGTPAVRDGVVYVGTSDSARFMALDAGTGRLLHEYNVRAFIFSSAALAGEIAYVGSFNGRLYAIDTETGEPTWEFQTEGARADSVGVLLPDGRLNFAVFAPVFNDFQDMYIAFLRFISIGAIVSSPAVDRGVVFVGSMDGNVYAIE